MSFGFMSLIYRLGSCRSSLCRLGLCRLRYCLCNPAITYVIDSSLTLKAVMGTNHTEDTSIQTLDWLENNLFLNLTHT